MRFIKTTPRERINYTTIQPVFHSAYGCRECLNLNNEREIKMVSNGGAQGARVVQLKIAKKAARRNRIKYLGNKCI